MTTCSGPHGSLRLCHERLYEHGSKLSRIEEPHHFCELHGTHFCWDCCAFYCSTHAVARHDGHRVEDYALRDTA